MISSDVPLVSLRGVMKRYRRTGFHLGPLNLDVGPGITCVVGANGAGKSTLFRVVAGLERPTEGQVDLQESGVKQRVGFMPQDPSQPRQVRCAEYLEHVAWLYGVPRGVREDRVRTVLEAVDLSARAGDRIGDLSGGMVRRMALAAALLPDPRVLLLDEPTVGLDPLQRIGMRETLLGLPSDRAVMVSTHLVEDVRALDGAVVVLRDGNVVFQGSVRDLSAMDPGAGPGENATERAIAALMSGDVGK